MRFFSNDAKDSADEQRSDEHPERVQSEPVAVPQQRAGSPWSDPRSPADADTADTDTRTDSESDNADAELADQERTDGTIDSGTPVNGYDAATTDTDSVRDESEERHDGDALVPSDESSAAPAGDPLGAHRVEDEDDSTDDNADDVTSTDVDDEQDSDRLAVQNADDNRDDEVDLPLGEPANADDSEVQDFRDQDDKDHDTLVQDETIDTATDGEPADDETPVATTTTYGPDGTVTTTAGSDEDTDDDEDDSSDSGLDSATAAADADVEAAAETDTDDGDPAVKDEGDFDDPTAVDPATEEPLDSTSDDDTSVVDEPSAESTDTTADEPDEFVADGSTADADSAPEVVPVPVPVGSAVGDENGKVESGGDKLPGTVTAPELGSLFAEADAQGFQDRWREVQLRFVDSPQDATAEAARLVDEAVDKLTASLKAQKDQVAHDNSNDTEQLRVELRGYRDILNRVLGL